MGINVIGTEFDNDIVGSGGADTLTGGEGNDTIDGGGGVDTAVFLGSMAGYSFGSDRFGQLTVTDTDGQADGNDGIDSLTNVERLSFSDGRIWVTSYAESRINTTTQNDQYQSFVTSLKDGGYVVAWTSAEQDGSFWGVYCQRFDARGRAVGDEIRVNSTTDDDQWQPAIAGLSDGGYLIVWSSQSSQPGEGWDIYSQRFGADGAAVGPETRVSSASSVDQILPAITELADGAYVVTWTSYGQDGDLYGIFSQLFSADGVAVGSEKLVNVETLDDQYSPVIAGLIGGGYVVSWSSYGLDGSDWNIFARRFGADGEAIGGDVLVNTTAAGPQNRPAMAALSDGGYVLTWESYTASGSAWDVHAQRFDQHGNALGGEFVVNTTLAGSQQRPAIASLVDGGFVVTWQSSPQDSNGLGIYAQRYSADGIAIGGEMRINSTVDSDQYDTSVAGLADGGFVVTWTSYLQDGSQYGIYSQRFNKAGGTVQLTGDGAANVITWSGSDPVVLLGGGGNDTLTGGDGVDYLSGGTGSDTVNYAHSVTGVTVSLAVGASNPDTLVSIENLIGSAFADDLSGNGFANTLDGGTGNDFLNGGNGNDRLFGGDDNDRLVGGGGADLIEGGDGNDTLIGGAGVDTLRGGAGDDIYTVETLTDRVQERELGGIDTIQTRISYRLPGQVENLVLLPTAISGEGNGLDNVITGNGAANALSGFVGNDTLFGGASNDTLSGGGGDDVLSGGSGADRVIGGVGSDTVTGGWSTDVFVFNTWLSGTNVDTITDFSVVDDTIELDDAIFKSFTAGVSVTEGQLLSRPGADAADTPEQLLIYDSTTGTLYYDADGSGDQFSAKAFAILSGAPGVTADDFFIG